MGSDAALQDTKDGDLRKHMLEKPYSCGFPATPKTLDSDTSTPSHAGVSLA